jgi:signal transduction histidine kinase
MVLTNSKNPGRFNYWAFIASSLFLLSLSIFSLIWFEKEKESENWISHTYQVKLKIERCYGLLLEAESDQRGYLLNNDDSYLLNIAKAENLLYSGLHELDSLISDNPRQVKNVGILQSLMLTRLSRLHILLDSMGHSGNFIVSHFTSKGRIIMDTINTQVRVMQAEEDALLEKRNFIKQVQDERVIIFIILFSIIAFAILMWSFLTIRSENLLRRNAQNEIIAQNEKLERQNRDLTTFANIASHDLKEPLRKIQMFTDRIADSNPGLTGRSLEYFHKISQQSYRMQVLIESILQYAQTEEGDFGFQSTDLNTIANLAVDSLSEIIKEKNAAVKMDSLPSVFGNPAQMEQLFINLIDNGIKYSRPDTDPLIEITASLSGESWKIDFSDNGIGFDESYEKKIFEVFQRLHSKEEYSGTGIGLAICKKIVENHRGSITARSELGKGSVFSVIFPVQKDIFKP